MGRQVLLRTVKRALVVLAVLAALYAAFGFLLVPWLAQQYLPQSLEDRLGRDVSVGEFRANPFLLTFEAHRVTVEGRHGRPMLAIERLFADASLPGLLRGVWALDQLALEGAQAHLVLRADGSFNFAEAAAAAGTGSGVGSGSGSGPSTAGPPAIRIGQLTVRDAQLVFTDLRAAEPAQATVQPVTLGAQNLSTLADDSPGSYELTASLPAQGALELRGALGVQPAGVAGNGQVQLRNLQARTLQPFLSADLPVSKVQGRLDLSGRYAHGPGEPLRFSGLSAAGSDVLVAVQGERQPIVEARRIAAQGGSLDLRRRTARIEGLVLAEGRVNVTVASDANRRQARGATARLAGVDARWHIEVPKLRLEQIGLNYVHRDADQPLTLEAAGVSGELQLALETGAGPTQLAASGVQAQWEGATLRIPRSQVPVVKVGATALEQGRLDLRQRRISAKRLRVEAGRVSIVNEPKAAEEPERRDEEGAPWNLVLEHLEVAGLGGRYGPPGKPAALEIASIDGHTRLELAVGGPRTQVMAGGLDAKVRGAVFPDHAQAPAVRLASGQVSGGRFDLAARRLGAARVELSGDARLVRNTRGQLVLPALLMPQDSPPARSGPEARQPWRYAFDVVRVPSLELVLSDRSMQPVLQLRGTLQGSAKDIASDRAASFDARLTLEPGGTLTAAGTMAPRAEQVRARVEASRVALRPFQPLLARVAALKVQSGAASGSASLQYGPGAGAMRLDGNLGIAGLRLDEAASGDRFLSWKQLDVLRASLDLGARRFAADEVRVQQPGAKILISEDRKLNLVQVLKEDAPRNARDGREKAPGFAFEVGRVRLRDGEVDFADLSLVLPFSTTVRAVDGTIAGISSDPSQRAGVKAQGAIEPYGSAQVEGSLLPAAPSEFTDLRVGFDNVPVPPLSPYTATFAGRKVESGRLWLDLRYRVDDGELRGSNDIRLQNFRLGERVQAPNAMDIPLDLAVALLKDASGEIRLSVPVTGEVGNARFSVGSAVRQAVGNVLERVVSAPFRALAKLFGGDADSLAAIGFEPGSAQLRPQEREKLDALTRALRERPQLRLVVVAPYDPQLDTRALQREQARRDLARALGREVGAGEDPGPVPFDDPAARRELRRMLRSLAGHEAVRELEQRFASEPHQLYEAMFERIVQEHPLTGGGPQVLGVERAREIAGYLQRQGIDGSRVRTGMLASVRAGQNGEVSSQLEVAAAAGSSS